ncbi:hypothetical protein [Paraburkholderia susongensis]|uniref:Lipoprotein n=1 Tax=Paraburkholderia susongensis TaxID=1515439 RepID=A0A1X7LNA1_9BURK|nr:hypothetical protein [Paraburkholderia susongensis]SMG54994.1 hypothetical protein SAMN06265784_10781 [Paraburkholderia susongensis]
MKTGIVNFIRPGNLLKTLAALGLAAWLVGCAQAVEPLRTNSQRTQPSITLWQAIDVLAQQIPFSRSDVENVLSTHLVEKDTSRSPIQNTAFQFYTGGPIKLSDDVVISNVDLRIRNRATHPGFLVLNLDGSCITLDMVRAHYSNLKVTDRPRGRSLDEVTSHTTALQWGELSFSFKERNPNCLSSLAFDPKSVETDNVAK